MKISILTLFPMMFDGPLGMSILGRAQANKLLNIKVWDIREFAQNKHRVVDDAPYGGGAGMVLKPDVVVRCIEHVKTYNSGPVIYLTPQGVPFTQNSAKKLAEHQELIFLCGHYEGLDERVRAGWIDHEISIGDYVLTGGELPTMVVIDTVARLIPGVLGAAESVEHDSFMDGLLEHPHYTRPERFRDSNVPDVLLSGNHDLIRKWRLKESLRRTLIRRPDLLTNRELTIEEKSMLAELGENCD